MSKMKNLRQFLSDNGLSIALFSMFVVCLIGQSLTGWPAYNRSLVGSGFHATGFWAFLKTGTFLDGIMANWQAAILQLAVLITFSSVLRQRGAAHSRKSDDEPKKRPPEPDECDIKPKPLSRWLYCNSLSLAMIGTFVCCFVLHAIFGSMQFNETAMLQHQPRVSFGHYIGSGSFWFTVCQTWEAEFFAIGFYLILTIYLRQEHSPESKRTDAPDDDTGDTNE